MEDHQKELQLLPTPHTTISSYARASPWPLDPMRFRSNNILDRTAGPSLDLQLSISLRPMRSPPDHCMLATPLDRRDADGCQLGPVQWQAGDQIRKVKMEKAYVERVKEMTKREMEMAQSEFTRARHMWERAREEVERVEKMKERASRRIDSNCVEITCQACRQKFRH